MDAPLHAFEHGSQRSAFASIDRTFEELSLTPVPMGRDHEPARHLVCDARAEIAADHMQAQIESCGAPRRRQDPALVDIEHVWVNAYSWMATLQRLRVPPVRRCPLAVEQTGGGEYE